MRGLRWGGLLAACAGALTVIACGSSPVTPSPPTGGGGGVVTPPANNPPAIASIAIQGARAKEPANYADVNEPVTVTAFVSDDETPVANLQFNWSAPVGTFSGTGPIVTWQAPASATTPMDVQITLQVVERYGSTPNTFEHRVSGTASLSLHDAAKEVGEMSRQFLLDFSDSNIRDIASIMRNFQPGCYGTADETAQVTENRRRYRITDSSVGAATTTVNFGGLCPYGPKKGDACTAVPVFWQSNDLDHAGSTERVRGTDWLASVYVPTQKRWWLCDSSFEGQKALGSTFIR